MTTGPERGLRELYADPERADFELWGRRAAGTDRRGFLKGAGLAAMERFLRAGIPMARYMPAGLIPVPLAGAAQSVALPGKSGLILLSDRPIGAECPAHLLDDSITPVERLFVRNNGLPPFGCPLRGRRLDRGDRRRGLCLATHLFVAGTADRVPGTHPPTATGVRG